MKQWVAMSIFVCLVLSAFAAPGHAEDIVFNNVDIPKLDWGTQTAVFSVTNTSDYLKFLKTETKLTFQGIYLNPERVVTNSFIVLPGESRDLPLEIQVPGNYGSAELVLTVYDVIDTLDPIFPGQEIYQQPFELQYEPDKEAREYLNPPLQVPPTVQESMDFDYEFARLLPFLISQGKSLDDIQDMTIAGEDYAATVLDSMVAREYMAQTPDGPEPTFPVLTEDAARKGSELADKIAGLMTDQIASNLATYPQTLDSLVKAKIAPVDSNTFMHGGTILYFTYPMVTAFLLWFDLGQEFITQPVLLDIYKNSDPCNSHIPRYMYMVQGNDSLDGVQFYHAEIEPSKFVINFADHEPPLDCVADYWTIRRPLMERVDWSYPSTASPEPFLIDTAAVYAGLRHLRSGTPDIVARAKTELANLDLVKNPIEGQFGLRYWFWNLVATRTTQALIDRGALVRRGNGAYRLELSRMGRP